MHFLNHYNKFLQYSKGFYRKYRKYACFKYCFRNSVRTCLYNNKLKNGLFETFFTNKILQIRNSLTSGVNPISRSLLSSCVSFSEFLPVSDVTIHSILKKFPKKSRVLDPWPTKLLYQNIGIILPVITRIVNSSLTEGYFPSSLKNAAVRPLLKKSSLDSNSLGNYRRGANLPFLVKVIEKVVAQQLVKHLSNHGLDDKFQSAYKAGHSCETALLPMM